MGSIWPLFARDFFGSVGLTSVKLGPHWNHEAVAADVLRHAVIPQASRADQRRVLDDLVVIAVALAANGSPTEPSGSR